MRYLRTTYLLSKLLQNGIYRIPQGIQFMQRLLLYRSQLFPALWEKKNNGIEYSIVAPSRSVKKLPSAFDILKGLLKLFQTNSEKTKATNLQLLTYISFSFCLGFFNLILYIFKINLTNIYKVLRILVVLTLFRLNGKNKEIRKIALEVHQPTIGNDGNSVISITNYYQGRRLR